MSDELPDRIAALFEGDRPPAAAVALLFALLSGVWITVSDRMLARLVQDPMHLTTLQTYKGWGFVAVTAVLLFFFLWGVFRLRRRFRDARSEQDRFLYTLLKNVPGMAYRCRNDRDWTIEFVSQGASPLTGYSVSAFTRDRSVTWTELMHPEDRERVRRAVREAVARNGPFRVEYRIRTRAGETKWVWEQGRPVHRNGEGPDASPVLEGFILDITALKSVREEEVEEPPPDPFPAPTQPLGASRAG